MREEEGREGGREGVKEGGREKVRVITVYLLSMTTHMLTIVIYLVDH